MRLPFDKQLLFIFVGLLCSGLAAHAQLNAGFSADKTGGCSPLTVHFTNTSNGSPAAVYKWDFGNGNTSALKYPGAVFLDKKPYTVTLTVTDGSQTSSTTRTITVYQNPVVDFSSSLKQLCTPEPATFTAKATADNGVIANYMWDFGDGFTQRSYSAQVTHTYLTAQDPQVRLTVTDNNGCSNSKTISNIIKVFNGIHAAFDADKTFICFQPDPVQMINKSDGEGALQYSWDFGDGISSTQKDPSHVFSSTGAYTVRLAIENTNGCTDTLVKTSYLNVGNFKSQLEVPDIICQNSTVEIKNTSTPAPSSSTLVIDGVQNLYPDYYGRYFYTFSIAGQHTIVLTNKFGDCDQSVTKKVEVKELLQPNGFIVNIPKYCFPPVTVNFQDTTTGAVKSEWNFDSYYPPSIQATGKAVSNNFISANTWNVTLFVTDANGCKNSVSKPVTITQPYVSIQTIDNNNVTCESLTKKFTTYSNVQFASFTWSFGDGATSTEAEPEHTFTTGSYYVTLKYTTTDGCSGQTNPLNIIVYSKPKADFKSLSGSTICGNSGATFVKNFANSQWDSWYVNQQFVGNASSINYIFSDTGRYSITLISSNPGCNDTSTQSVTVLPSFPLITQVLNTCEGERGTVTFSQASKYAQKWTWNFGDGTTGAYVSDKPQVSHHYSQSGYYNVTLTTANNTCSNIALTPAIVLLKQYPVLSAAKTTLCSDEQLNFSLTNLDITSYPYISYYLQGYQYNDGTTFPPDYYWITQMPFSGTIRNVQKGKDSVRLITNSSMGCSDTSNFIPIKVKGAVAGFEILSNNVCFKSPVSFKDTSTAENTSIISRQWNFGDGKTLTKTSGGIVYHTYSDPGNYNVTLTVSDAGGCTSSTSTVSYLVNVNGPKVNFSTYGNTFHLNSTVQFYNNTNNYNSYNTQYKWDFGDGTSATDYYPAHTYTSPGNYTITLVATNPDDGCSDTMQQTITIKYFNANFSFTSSFVNSNDCSATLVQFNNTSYDYTEVKWDFGDGFTAGNVNYPSHVYTQPGSYVIKLFVTGNNGLSKTYTDTLVIKDNKVKITASMNHTCTAQSVTMSALTGDASAYLWDFGDGTVVQASDSVIVHYYKTPGNYIPKLIATDQTGCTASVELNEKISIDSLSVSLKEISKICTPKEVQFNPEIVNLASDGGQQPLMYHWDFGTGNKTDTANTEKPSFMYQQPGNYTISLKVQSADGCKKEANVNIVAQQGLGGQINGPSEICVQSAAQFTGSTLLPGQPTWQWIFDDGSIVNQQNPPPKEYDNAGNFMVKLVVNNNGCIDTVNKLLQVHSKPVVSLSSNGETLCEGSSVSVTAGGGKAYSWSPSAGLNNAMQATVIASPVTNTDYVVTVTNSYGCTNTGSLKIKVIHPFTLQLVSEVAVCSGNSTRLQASGGIAYEWIGNTAGLNSVTVPDPVATPSTSTTYTVVAHGENQCFSDTAAVYVKVNPTPFVNLGNDTTICEGQTTILKAFTANATYVWQDGSTLPDYTVSKAGRYVVLVNLDNCSASDTINIMQKAIPYFTLGPDSSICSGEAYVLTPSLNTEADLLWQNGSTAPSFAVTHEGMYALTASNKCGSHTDSVTITKGVCNILMPTGFTPNNDGLNDVFRVKYPFSVTRFHFQVTSRWGQKVFETSNIHDGWDGTYKGEPALEGVYVWVISFIDVNGKNQQLMGTVTLIR